MSKIRKYQFMTFLEELEKKGCKTIDDIKDLLNNDLENDMDIVFEWYVGVTKKEFEISKKGESDYGYMDKKSK